MRLFPGTRPAFVAIFLATSVGVGYGAVALDSLGVYLTKNGYGGAQLIHPGNFYLLPIQSDDKRGNLLVDTGTPNTLIFRSSLKRLNLVELKTGKPVVGAFGKGRDVIGLTNIKVLRAGNCMLTNVPVEVAAGSANDFFSRTHPNGLLGLRELVKFGAVLDLQNQLLYLRPSRPGREVSAEIKSILLRRGYIRVPLSVTDGHLRVAGALNGIRCDFIVDTGGYLTMLSPSYVARAKLKLIPTRLIARGLSGGSSPIGMIIFPSLRIGDYEIRHGSASVSRLDPNRFGEPLGIAGLLGIEYLAMNSAVFDFIDGTLYLRPGRR